MQTTVKIPYTVDREVPDVTTCDGCATPLDMNLSINDRTDRYTSDQVKVVGRYFTFRRYDRFLEESEYMHLCPKCMHAKIAAWCKPDVDEEIEYDMESHTGKIIPEEIKAMQEKAEEAKEEVKTRHEAEKAAAIEQCVADEEEMLDRLFNNKVHV